MIVKSSPIMGATFVGVLMFLIDSFNFRIMWLLSDLMSAGSKSNFTEQSMFGIFSPEDMVANCVQCRILSPDAKIPCKACPGDIGFYFRHKARNFRFPALKPTF